MTNYDRMEELFDNLREDYYEVALYKEGEEDYIETFETYGTPKDLVSIMDSILIDLGYGDEDWSKMSAAIGFDDWTIVYMPSLDGPEYEFVSDIEAFEALAA